MDPLPGMNKIFSLVLQHERQNNLAPVEDSQPLINLVGLKKFNSKNGNLATPFNFSNPKSTLIIVE